MASRPHPGNEHAMFTCPTHDRPLHLDDSRLLSAHATSHGRLAYFRCVCDGLVIAAPQLAGHVIRHAAGPGKRVAVSPARLEACA